MFGTYSFCSFCDMLNPLSYDLIFVHLSELGMLVLMLCLMRISIAFLKTSSFKIMEKHSILKLVYTFFLIISFGIMDHTNLKRGV